MKPVAILGAGNIGTAIADGIVDGGHVTPAEVVLTRRKPELLQRFADRGFAVLSDNTEAVRRARLVVVAVEPQQIDRLLTEIAPSLQKGTHTIVSVVSGVSIAQIKARTPPGVPVVRVMPNTAVAIRESMTSLAAAPYEEIDAKGTRFGGFVVLRASASAGSLFAEPRRTER